ncbi:hypothetical protein ABPG77_004551 [Micractinium sp. CCAP 211/92]
MRCSRLSVSIRLGESRCCSPLPQLHPGIVQARALTQLGHEVYVIAGAPRGHAGQAAAAGFAASKTGAASGQAALAQRIMHVELPVWGRLDADCAWREFAAGVGAPEVAAAAAAFSPAAVLGVDWHSVGAYEQLRAALPGPPPFIYLNYRVYHRTANAEELAVVEAQEARALRLSSCSLVLSRSDAQYLRRHFPGATSEGEGAAPLHVLLPALRSDMAALAPPAEGTQQQEASAQPVQAQAGAHDVAAATAAGAASADGQQLGTRGVGSAPPGAHSRRYLTCCVRLSAEKEPHRFVDLVLELQRRGALERLGVVPLMAGSGWQTPYGREQRARVEAGAPQCMIHDQFLGPSELAAIYAATLLNVHPPTYDAYGMTIVEAASQGAPSLVQGGGHVGATDLLRAEAGEVLVCDMEQHVEQLANLVEALLAERARLAAVGRAAQGRARSWCERDNAEALVGHVQAALRHLGMQDGQADSTAA